MYSPELKYYRHKLVSTVCKLDYSRAIGNPLKIYKIRFTEILIQ